MTPPQPSLALTAAEEKLRLGIGNYFATAQVKALTAELDRLRGHVAELEVSLKSKTIAQAEHNSDYQKLLDWVELYKRVERENTQLKTEIAHLRSNGNQ